jgi:L-fuconolactonase
MHIDAHQHFWYYDPFRDQWIDESMAILKRDFLPAELKPLLAENDFGGCVAVQADQSEAETDFLLKLADKHDFIKGVVGWVDLCSSDIAKRLIHFARFPRLKGFRHIVQAEPDDFLLREDFKAGIRALAAHGFTYDLLVYPKQLQDAVELVQQFPDQPFVLDHMGKPLMKEGKIRDWEDNIRRLAQASNVYCKVSGLVTEAACRQWEEKDFHPYLDVVFDVFGVERLMIGSNWPVCLLSADYQQAISIINHYLAPFSAAERGKVLGENAVKFYNIS